MESMVTYLSVIHIHASISSCSSVLSLCKINVPEHSEPAEEERTSLSIVQQAFDIRKIDWWLYVIYTVFRISLHVVGAVHLIIAMDYRRIERCSALLQGSRDIILASVEEIPIDEAVELRFVVRFFNVIIPHSAHSTVWNIVWHGYVPKPRVTGKTSHITSNAHLIHDTESCGSSALYRALQRCDVIFLRGFSDINAAESWVVLKC